MSNFDMSNYIDVKSKIQMFIKAYPTGSLQFEFKGICDHNPDMIWGIAYAYRTPDDQRPGIGTAQELAIGKTSYTRGSELQNLESSCWGRAISALSIGLEKGIATLEEVAASIDRQESPQPVRTTMASKPYQAPDGNVSEATEKQLSFLFKIAGGEAIADWKEEHGISGRQLNKAEASAAIQYFQALGDISAAGITIERNN